MTDDKDTWCNRARRAEAEVERLKANVTMVADDCLSRASYMKGSVGDALESVANQLYSALSDD